MALQHCDLVTAGFDLCKRLDNVSTDQSSACGDMKRLGMVIRVNGMLRTATAIFMTKMRGKEMFSSVTVNHQSCNSHVTKMRGKEMFSSVTVSVPGEGHHQKACAEVSEGYGGRALLVRRVCDLKHVQRRRGAVEGERFSCL
jgi:hypothetical protein